MEGYTVLTRTGYTLVYALAAASLAVSAIGTALGLFAFGGVVWWPTFVLLALVFGLEVHSVYNRRLA